MSTASPLGAHFVLFSGCFAGILLPRGDYVGSYEKSWRFSGRCSFLTDTSLLTDIPLLADIPSCRDAPRRVRANTTLVVLKKSHADSADTQISRRFYRVKSREIKSRRLRGLRRGHPGVIRTDLGSLRSPKALTDFTDSTDNTDWIRCAHRIPRIKVDYADMQIKVDFTDSCRMVICVICVICETFPEILLINLREICVSAESA